MPVQRRSSGHLRALALQCETLVQAGLRRAAQGWARWRPRSRGLTAAAFRGRACHCPPSLPVHFVHSEGLREACDFVVDFGSNVRAPGRPAVAVPALRGVAAQIAPGAAVHVKTDLGDAFVTHVLPQLRGPVVLVTGDSDASMVQRHRALLDDRRVAHWFAQNCDWPGRHPKLTRIPIGLDNPIYTKLEKRLGFAVTMALGRTPLDLSCRHNDIGDQRALNDVRIGLPPTATRPRRALCTFHQNQKIIRADVSGLPDRAEACRVLAESPACEFVPQRLRQRACWERHAQFAFEVSPRGNGLDCFRTWEALALGAIPIVRNSTLDPLYLDEGLPVVIVRDWAEITPEHLGRWHDELAGRFTAELERKLSLGYWVERIKMASRSALAR